METCDELRASKTNDLTPVHGRRRTHADTALLQGDAAALERCAEQIDLEVVASTSPQCAVDSNRHSTVDVDGPDRHLPSESRAERRRHPPGGKRRERAASSGAQLS